MAAGTWPTANVHYRKARRVSLPLTGARQASDQVSASGIVLNTVFPCPFKSRF